MRRRTPPVDIVMAGTFAAWRLGTLQARALPFARELLTHGIRCAIVTTPWDMPAEAGVVDTIAGIELHNTQATGITSFPFAVAQQRRQILALQPQAVHVFKPKGFGGLTGRLLGASIPLIIDSDDWEGDGGWNQAGGYSLLQRRLFDWQERTLLQRATAVTAASYLLVRRARSLRSAPPGTVSWIPNGLEIEWAHRLARARAEAMGDDNNRATIVLYSRFAEFRSDWLSRYLSTLSSALAQHETATVVLVGDSPLMSYEFRNLCIEPMGYVAYDEIPSILGTSTIAIFPYADSLIARSKNSVKLLELMAAGCAVIASSIGDVPAVAGDNALLLDSADPDAFAAETVKMLRNPQRIDRLSADAQRRALTQFSIPIVTRRLVDAYRNAGVLPTC